MSSTSTTPTADVETLVRLLHSEKVIVRYLLSRFDRETNAQDFYAEVISLHHEKDGDKYLVNHLKFNIEVADFYVKSPSGGHFDPAELLDHHAAEESIRKIIATWKDWPRGWRSNQLFAGVLRIGEERLDLPPTNGHFQFYHGRIEATLAGLTDIAYREVGATGDLTQYHSLLTAHAKFARFAGNSCIGRTLNAFREG